MAAIRLLRRVSIPVMVSVLMAMAWFGGTSVFGASPTTTSFMIDPGDGGNYAPRVNPASFVDVVDNRYFPLPVGATWHYEGTERGKPEAIDITVTGDSKVVLGVPVVVVRDTVTKRGKVTEDTYDWFAQDQQGNVWYFGEATQELKNGKVVGTEGSWEAGVDGAYPGIVMPATPRTGDVFRQEYLPGVAEDMMLISSTGEALTVAAGSFEDAVVTDEWTPLEPGVVERKWYAPGVGRIKEQDLAGGDEVVELVSYHLPG